MLGYPMKRCMDLDALWKIYISLHVITLSFGHFKGFYKVLTNHGSFGNLHVHVLLIFRISVDSCVFLFLLVFNFCVHTVRAFKIATVYGNFFWNQRNTMTANFGQPVKRDFAMFQKNLKGMLTKLKFLFFIIFIKPTQNVTIFIG